MVLLNGRFGRKADIALIRRYGIEPPGTLTRRAEIVEAARFSWVEARAQV